MASSHKQNKLADALSPYLLQHANNPVEWYPWGEEAIALAKQQDKPIFLSIGYSACHWCHVMAHESFEDDTIANQMNRDFINIKVDREERPDLDEIYMAATQLMTGSGGWPMSVFLNHDLTPFFAGTYFPPVSKFGRISFPQLLERVTKLWKDERKQLLDQGRQMLDSIQRIAELHQGEEPISELVVEKAVTLLKKRFDPTRGGFGNAPKFPDPQSLLLLMREYVKNKEPKILDMVEKTLTEMALGGIYDHLGGGFARYSVDEDWLVPHFEKMLYDNAMLPRAYLVAWQLTKKPFYKRVVLETLSYILREMRDAKGGFYSAQDADSEGEEGKFYVWDRAELDSLLGEEDARFFAQYYDVTPEGNWEEKNILHLEKVLEEQEKQSAPFLDRLQKMRQILFEARSKRIPPGLDDKVLTEWNGLMIKTMANAGAVLERTDFIEAAIQAAEFIEKQLRTPDGKLLRVYRAHRAHTSGYQSDYAAYAEGCMALYEATFDPIWIERAESIVAKMNALFWDPQQGGYFYTELHASDVISRTKHPHDNPYSSGNTMAVSALIPLFRLTQKNLYQTQIEKTFQVFQGSLESQSFGFMGLLGQIQEWLAPQLEITFVGTLQPSPLLQKIREVWLPGKIVAAADPNESRFQSIETQISLFQGRFKATETPMAFVCVEQTCSLPIHHPDLLEQTLLQQYKTPRKKNPTVQLKITAEAKTNLQKILNELAPSVALKLHLNPQKQVELTAVSPPEGELFSHEGLSICFDPKLTSKTRTLTLDFQKGQFFLQ